MAYQRAKVSAFKIVSTRSGHPLEHEVGELSTVSQDLSNGGIRLATNYVTSPTVLPTSEL